MKHKEKMKLNPQTHTLNTQGVLSYVAIISATVLIFCAFVLYYDDTHYAHAQTYKHIAIDFSETCKGIQQGGDNETCSSPEFVKSLFPETKLKQAYQTMFDNANNEPKQPYQQQSILLNHKFSCVKEDYCNVFNILPGQKILYWYDPDYKTTGYYDAIITIQANIKHKNLNTSFDVIQDNGTNRKIDLDTNQLNNKYCKLITYKPDNIGIELGRIIWYVSDLCLDAKKLSYLADPFTIPLDKTDIGILENSYKWSWLNNQTAIKEKYKEYRIGKD